MPLSSYHHTKDQESMNQWQTDETTSKAQMYLHVSVILTNHSNIGDWLKLVSSQYARFSSAIVLISKFFLFSLHSIRKSQKFGTCVCVCVFVCLCVWERERGTDRDRDTHRNTHRQTHTQRQTYRQDRDIYTQTHIQSQRELGGGCRVAQGNLRLTYVAEDDLGFPTLLPLPLEC